jgi:hypothetical protein
MGYIYKILCNITNECYYGRCNGKYSRINCHTAKNNKTVSKQIIDRGNYTFIIVENDIEDDLIIEREYYYIKNFECINHTLPFIETDNKLHRNRKGEKDRYYTNKEFYKKKANDHYHNNIEKIKEKRKEKMICECGREINKTSKLVHLKSLCHKNYIANNI